MNQPHHAPDVARFRRLLMPTIVGVLVIAYFLANVEIQIEGAAGWAANLPTWRVAKNSIVEPRLALINDIVNPKTGTNYRLVEG